MTLRLPAEKRLIVLNGLPALRYEWLAEIINLYDSAYLTLACYKNYTDDIAQRILADVKQLPVSIYLVLDDCDALPDKELRRLLYILLEQTGSGIILSGRGIPACIYRDANLQRLCAFYPPSADLNMHIPELDVHALGHLTVENKDLTIVDTGDGQVAHLLLYMLEHAPVPRTQIAVNSWWSTTGEDNGNNSFHVVRRKLHQKLALKLITSQNGYLHLSSEIDFNYDVKRFREALATYEESCNIDDLTAAIAMYPGDFFIQSEVAWVKTVRNKLKKQYFRALLTLAKHYMQHTHYEAAIPLLTRVLRDEPGREDVTRRLMLAYDCLAMREDALKAYWRTKDWLARNMNLKTSPGLNALADRIAAGV